MTEQTNKSDRAGRIERLIAAWLERAEIARREGRREVAEAAEKVATGYRELTGEQDEPAYLSKANLLRKRIESTEQHRTMAAEHGLSNEAIDSTYEIQELERELIDLVRSNEVQ